MYTNSDGYILSGPEYLTIFNGQTGAALVTTNYIPAQRQCFRLGRRLWQPSGSFSCLRGVSGRAEAQSGDVPRVLRPRTAAAVRKAKNMLVAWNWRNGILTNLWTFEAAVNIDGNINSDYVGQGNHRSERR